MKLLFVTPYFPPEVGAPQTRIYELAVRLARIGHTVSILTTFPNYPSGVVPQEWRGKFFSRTVADGLTVYRIWTYATPNRGFCRRIISHTMFAIFAALVALFLPRNDVMIVESPPLFDGFIGVAARALRSIPYLFTVSDLWPESAIQLGMLKNRTLVWLSKRIELLFYRRSAAVLALTAGIREKIIADRIPAEKVLLFRNSVDCELFSPGPAMSDVGEKAAATPSDFLVVYAGNLGLAQNLSTVLECAALLTQEDRSNIRFVLAGDGAESDSLKQKAVHLGLTNVTFLPSLPKREIPGLLRSADCVLVPLRDLELFRGALPTKFFEAMACGKPVVLGIAGEAADLLSQADAGICVAPESSVALRDALIALQSDPAAACRMGTNGRNYVVQHFSREARAQDLDRYLNALPSNVSRRHEMSISAHNN